MQNGAHWCSTRPQFQLLSSTTDTVSFPLYLINPLLLSTSKTVSVFSPPPSAVLAPLPHAAPFIAFAGSSTRSRSSPTLRTRRGAGWPTLQSCSCRKAYVHLFFPRILLRKITANPLSLLVPYRGVLRCAKCVYKGALCARSSIPFPTSAAQRPPHPVSARTRLCILRGTGSVAISQTRSDIPTLDF